MYAIILINARALRYTTQHLRRIHDSCCVHHRGLRRVSQPFLKASSMDAHHLHLMYPLRVLSCIRWGWGSMQVSLVRCTFLPLPPRTRQFFLPCVSCDKHYVSAPTVRMPDTRMGSNNSTYLRSIAIAHALLEGFIAAGARNGIYKIPCTIHITPLLSDLVSTTWVDARLPICTKYMIIT